MKHSLSRRGVKALGAVSAGFALMLALLAANSAMAEPRVALVIGNSAYQGDLPALPNPANDAKLMAQTLKSVGFDVVEAEDANKEQMIAALGQFRDKLVAAGNTATGLFFYAGHGLQVAGENYLIPVDAKIQAEKDVDLASLSANTVMKQMEFAAPAVNIIILDACRNNPLGDGARSMSRGLAKIETAPSGSFIAYSTAPGMTAADGDGVNSPYTKALAETITEPGLSIADVFQEVRTKVLASTGQEQRPWDSSSLTGRFYFKASDATQTVSLTPPPAVGDTAADDKLKTEIAYWQSVKDTGDPDSIQLYLNKYPSGYFVKDANAKLDEIKNGTKVASAEPAPAAEQPRESVQPPQPAAAPAAAQPAAMSFIAQSQTVYAKAGGQVRAEPNSKASMVSKLPTNTEVTATGISTDGKWWRVALADGQTGYMHSSVVSEQPVQMAAAPAPSPAPTQVAQADGRGLEMVDGAAAAPTPAPATSAADAQALGQLASAVPNGNLNGLGQALSGLFSGGQSQQQAAAPQVQFQPMNGTVTVKRGAVIRANPVYNAAAIARASQDTKVQAQGRTANNLWWEVRLPNGQVGYIEGRMISQ